MKTKLSLVSLLFAVGSLLGPARAETIPAKTIAAAAERAIENAYLRADAAALADAVKPLDAAIARAPNDPALLYTRAFAHYASSVLHRKPTDRAALQQCFETSVSLLERVKGAPWEAEADALRASILGQLIGLKGGMSGMTLGPQSDRLLQRAEKAAPGNPRVLMFRGISLLNTPAIFGGDTAAGTKLLQQAVDRFAAGSSPTNGPQWGQADALTWLGIGKQKAGDTAGARAAWQQALALEPNYAWVKFALLPSLDQKQNRK
jgi:Tfp pilus assembly protein PilF